MAARKTPEPPRSVSPTQALVELTQAALAGMRASVESLEKGIAALHETVVVLQSAVFGHWDKDQNQQVPGLQTRFEELQREILDLKVAMVADRAAIAKRDKWVLIIGSVVLGAILAKALGFPMDLYTRLLTLSAGAVH